MDGDVEQLIKNLFWRISAARTVEDAWPLLTDFSDQTGFGHCRFSVFRYQEKIEYKSIQFILTHDGAKSGWAQYYFDQRMYEYDQSVRLVSQPGVDAMKWTEMDKATRKGSKANSVFTEARKYGIGEGLTTNTLRLATSHTCFLGMAGAADVLQPFGRNGLKALIRLMHVCGERLHSLAYQEGLIKQQFPKSTLKLTPRQREYLIDFSNGMTAAEIAARDGLKESAINKAVERMKNNNGISSIPALVAQAMRDKLIS